MDILNFISWIKGKRQFNVVDPNKTLLPIGIKDGRRDDEYIAGAISVQDFITQVGAGTPGPQGPQGIQGPVGPGVASGGDAGQVLVKVDSVNYNTTWVDPLTIVEPVAIRWSPTFQATGLTFTGSGVTYPTYNSYYVKFGQMVSFSIIIELSTVTNFGTGQFKAELPFIPIPTASNHFSAWSWVNPALPPDELNGHIQMVADHLPGSQILDLHWLKETTATPKPLIESLLVQGTPITFTTASKMYINGTYIAQN